MDAKPPGPGPAPEEQPSPGEDSLPEERFGPLELRRLRKDDGRALILYRRSLDPE
jgi:hypothetical protein